MTDYNGKNMIFCWFLCTDDHLLNLQIFLTTILLKTSKNEKVSQTDNVLNNKHAALLHVIDNEMKKSSKFNLDVEKNQRI